MRRIFLLLLMAVAPIVLADVEFSGTHIRYYGSGTNDNDILFTTGDLTNYSACMLMSTTGAVDVFVSLDGTNFSTAALSLQDFGATDGLSVVVTAAGRVYGFVSKFRKVRVLQNGATAAAASMNCW